MDIYGLRLKDTLAHVHSWARVSREVRVEIV